jgi:hypothetical protein
MKLRFLNPPKGGQPSTPKAVRNQANALRRLSAPKKARDDDGLRRFLRVDPAVEETMRKAGL